MAYLGHLKSNPFNCRLVVAKALANIFLISKSLCKFLSRKNLSNKYNTVMKYSLEINRVRKIFFFFFCTPPLRIALQMIIILIIKKAFVFFHIFDTSL